MNGPAPAADFHAHAPIPEVEGPVGDGSGPKRERWSVTAYSGARPLGHYVAMLGDEVA